MEDKTNNEHQLKAFMEALPFISWFKDSYGSFSRVNSQFLESVKLDPPDVIGKKNPQVFDEVEALHHEDGDREVMDSERISQSTYSRKQRIFKEVKFPVLDEKGRIMGTGGYQEDITNLSRSLQELHMEKEYLEALLENIPYYIFFTDRHHRYIRINRLMARLLGVSRPEEAKGKSNEEFFTRRVARKMIDEDRQIMDSGSPLLNKIIYFEDERIEGFWMEKNKIPIKDER